MNKQMRTEFDTGCVTAVPSGVGGAVGVSGRHWYVAIVRNNTEKAVSGRLAVAGYECYLPTQEEFRVWRDGRRRKIERVVIPGVIFIRCSERERREAVRLPYIHRFMTDRACQVPGRAGHPLAVIPDSQIQTLRFMLGNAASPVTVSAEYRRGDRVRVVRGGLRGLEGEILKGCDGGSELIVRIDIFGCARLTIDRGDVCRI